MSTEHARSRRRRTAERRAIPELVIISGMSGAGRSTAAKCLEDLGWFVVDNLPPAPDAHDGRARRPLAGQRRPDRRRRRRPRPAFFDNLRESLARPGRQAAHPRIVFLEASDDALVRRFESVRRPHPLQGDGRIVDGIAGERELLRELRGDADLVIDTSSLNVHELRRQDGRRVRRQDEQPGCAPRSCRSASSTACRSTPTSSSTAGSCPTRTGCPELRPAHRPRRGGVATYVFNQPGAKEFLDRYTRAARSSSPPATAARASGT